MKTSWACSNRQDTTLMDSDKNAPQKPAGCFVFFLGYCVLSMLIIGGLVFIVFGIVQLIEARVSLSWATCEGIVTHSEVKKSSGRRGSAYSANIRYDYVVDGKQYTGNRYRFVPINTSNSRPAQKTVDEYPIGFVVKVYYSPNMPEKSVLVPGPTWGVYFLIALGMIVALISLRLLIATVSSHRNQNDVGGAGSVERSESG